MTVENEDEMLVEEAVRLHDLMDAMLSGIPDETLVDEVAFASLANATNAAVEAEMPLEQFLALVLSLWGNSMRARAEVEDKQN